MREITLPCKHYIPYEIVDMIADYHDYEKYCKPQHYEVLKGVINDIGDIANTMQPIPPHLVRQCWGVLSYLLEYDYNDDYNDYDDEENNFGLDYDHTHYYNDDEENIDDGEYLEYLADW